MAKTTPPKLGRKAAAMWREITSAYELRPDECRVLEDACRECDLIDILEAAINDPAEPLTVKGSMGQPVVNPLIAEIRQHRATMAGLLRGLKLPDEAAPSRSAQARDAAKARWGRSA